MQHCNKIYGGFFTTTMDKMSCNNADFVNKSMSQIMAERSPYSFKTILFIHIFFLVWKGSLHCNVNSCFASNICYFLSSYQVVLQFSPFPPKSYLKNFSFLTSTMLEWAGMECSTLWQPGYDKNLWSSLSWGERKL